MGDSTKGGVANGKRTIRKEKSYERIKSVFRL